MGNYCADKFNVPGSTGYDPTKPTDIVLRSFKDVQLRGYWLERDEDRQIVFVSDQSGADYVVLDEDVDGTPVIVYDDELTQDLTLYGSNTFVLRRYS